MYIDVTNNWTVKYVKAVIDILLIIVVYIAALNIKDLFLWFMKQYARIHVLFNKYMY